MARISAFAYYGGKSSKLKFILPQLDTPHRMYVELCAGSAAVLLNKPRVRYEIINDRAEEVADFWRAMRECPEELEKLIDLTPAGELEYKRCINAPPTDDLAERARRFYVRVTQSFSSMPNIPHYSQLRGLMGYDHGRVKTVVDRFRGVRVENRDVVRIIERIVTMNTTNTVSPVLFYADPPYTVDSRGSTGEYLHDDFDHDAFLDAVLAVPDSYKFAISGYANDLYDDRLADWHRVTAEFKCTANNKYGHTNRTEVLWRNYDLETNQQRIEL